MMRTALLTPFRRAVLTVLMAYGLVLQTVLLSLGAATHAAPAGAPQDILCLREGQTRPDHAPATDHDRLCCTLGCHAGAAAAPTPAFVLAERLAPVAHAMRAPGGSQGGPSFSQVLPVGSRAPPRLG